MTELLAVPIPDAARLRGVGRGPLYAKISKANLKTRKVRRRAIVARLVLKGSLAFDMDMGFMKRKGSRLNSIWPKPPKWVVVFILLSALGQSYSSTFSFNIRTQGYELELRYCAGLHPPLPLLEKWGKRSRVITHLKTKPDACEGVRFCAS
jgi:hypothetical protein